VGILLHKIRRNLHSKSYISYIEKAEKNEKLRFEIAKLRSKGSSTRTIRNELNLNQNEYENLI